MKATTSAFLILTFLIIFSYSISAAQEKVLIPIYYEIEDITKQKESVKESTLKECIKLLKEKDFIIKLGIPDTDYDKVHILMEKALIYLKENDNVGFLTSIKECKIQLKSMLEHCDITLDNIL